ncbi:MAG: AMP-binding protein [Bacteroidales bacterium]|nr:AMP-binding protein [Bacteroidales bacterium]
MIDRNFVQLYETSFKENWELNALTDYSETDTFTYGEVAEQIARIHIVFKKLGVRKGDKISLIGKNNTKWCIAYMSVVTYGAVIVPILQEFNPNDMHHIVNHSDSVLLFASDQIWENLEEDKLEHIRIVFSLTDFRCLHQRDGENIREFMKTLDSQFNKLYPEGYKKEHVKFQEVPNKEIILINYTSGTTGFSKGVMLTGNNLAGNVTFGVDTKLHFRGSRCVSFLPLAHAYGCSFDFLTPMAAGSHIHLLGKIPSPKILLKAFEEVKPSLICSVPLILEKIYRKQIVPKLSKTSIRWALSIPFVEGKIYSKIRNTLVEAFGGEFSQIVIGGAPLNKEVEEFLKKIKFPFSIGYGMTECGPLISFTAHPQFIVQSAGQILKGMEVRIESEDPFNIPGEILVRGEHVMVGYYKNEEATKAVLDDEGWLHTGDMGTINEDNHIFIRGRSKSMILGASGQNIYPEEIEAKLNNLPCVMESLIIEKNGKLVALVYPDYETLDSMGVDMADLPTMMEENRTTLNKIVAPYESVSSIQLYPTEFEKTPKRSIKRFLYSQITH